MTHDEALEILRTTIVALSSLPDARVVRAYTAQVPQLRVGHLHLTPLARFAGDFPYRVDDDELHQQREAEVQIDALGADACAALESVHAKWWSDSAPITAMLAAGVGPVGLGDLDDTTTVDRTAYVPRLTCRVGVSYLWTASDAPGPLATSVVLDLHGEGAVEVDLLAVATVPVP